MVFEVQFLALAAQVKADEVTQVFEGKLSLYLELEGKRTVAVGTGLLPHLHHHFAGFRLGEDQLASNGKEVVPFRQGVGGIGLVWSQGAGFPDPSDLQMQMITFTASGIHDPEVGLIQGQMPPHQGEHTTEHDGFQGDPLGIGQGATGELLGVGWGVSAAHKTDGPVLQRLCDRGNRMGAH